MSLDHSKFLSALESAGLHPEPFEPVTDGRIHRFRSLNLDGPRKLNGWYVLNDGGDFTAGAFGHWKIDLNETYCSQEYQTFTHEEKTAYKAKMEAIRKAVEEEKQREREKCRAWCAEKWKAAPTATDEHPYLKKKGVTAYGLKLLGESLMVPVKDQAGNWRGMQFIPPDGKEKRFKTGTDKAGGFLSIGKPKDDTIIIAEGYATAASIHEATGHCVLVAFDAGNLKTVAEAVREKRPGFKIILAADNDQWTAGNPGLTKATEAARAVGGLLAIPTFQDTTGRPTDLNDLHQVEGLDRVREIIEAAATPSPRQEDETPNRVRVIEAIDFMQMDFPPRENILSPWLPRQGLAMVYAPRGIGKTHFSLGIAYAVTGAGTFLSWSAPSPRGVLFLDGEMPAYVLQERLARIAASSEYEPSAPLRIVTPDLQPSGMIDLSKAEDHRALDPYVDGVDLIVIDNLSTLCRTGKENEGEGWLPVQAWALQQRAAGRSVLFIHHAGKNGEQRGTSRREDVLDTVIALKRPGDYTPDKGACFEVHFEKARGIFGEETKPFEAQLIMTPDGRQTWTMKPLEDSTAEKVARLLNDGIPQHEIAELLGISKGAVSKAKKKAGELGLLKSVS